jgi:hypothetical protein
MSDAVSFHDALEVVEGLAPDDQAELIEIIRRRLIERRRERLTEEVREARAEHAAGSSRAVSARDLLDEILS